MGLPQEFQKVNRLSNKGPQLDHFRSPSIRLLKALRTSEHTKKRTMHLSCDGFACLSPVTHEPELGRLRITYTANDFCISVKSLNSYLDAYRQTPICAEKVVNTILDAVIAVCRPISATVAGEFVSDGTLFVTVCANYPARKSPQALNQISAKGL